MTDRTAPEWARALPTRRAWLRTSAGLLGLSLPEALGLSRPARAADGFGKARSCIALFCWGGMSHLETFDPKPDAPREVRGDYRPIATSAPGTLFGEYMPLLARQAHRLAVVRSAHHQSSAHGKGMYWTVTGHAPPAATVAVNQPPTRGDWPCLGAMVARLRRPHRGLPGAVQVPYPLVDNNTLQAGDNAGWLGQAYDPVLVRPASGRPYGGVSRDLGAPVLKLAEGVDAGRLGARAELARRLDGPRSAGAGLGQHHRMALDMLLDPKVRSAFDVEREDVRLRDAYGRHICGQSVLLARRLTEAGVPFVQVVCAAGDLNGSAGDHWDTHGANFRRLKNDLLPPFEQALSALLDDLASRGRLAETLVVVLTEFGRTPRINGGAGRDHFPNCYSVALAGGGVRGGQVYGRSDRIGSAPADRACGPADVHATVFHALGVAPEVALTDNLGRPFPLTDNGRVLPLF
jgi:uncharacterized protein (DUF1501 family)